MLDEPSFGILKVERVTMKDQSKTKAQLLAELTVARQNLADLNRQLLAMAPAAPSAPEPPHLQTVQQEQHALIEAMFQINAALHSTLQYDRVLDYMLAQLNQLVPHDAACIIFFPGHIAHCFRWHGYARFGTKGVMPLMLAVPVTEIFELKPITETGRALLVTRATEANLWITPGQSWIKSSITAPIRMRGEMVGLVRVDSATPGFFTPTNAEWLETFTNHAVVALKNAWLYGQVRNQLMERIKAFKKEHAFVSAILDNASAFMLILDATGQVVRFNQTCLIATGYTHTEIENLFFWDILQVPEDAEKVQAAIQRMSPGHASEEYETQWLYSNGQRHIISWSSTVLWSRRNKPHHIILTGHDVTERKRIEEALRAGGERYALALQATNDGLWDWNLETNEIYFSSRWKAILGYQDVEIQPGVDEWFSRVHPEDLPRLKVDLSVYLEGRAANLKSEYRILHRSGEYRWVLTQGLLTQNTDGLPYRITGSQTDITGLKTTEESLRQASLHDVLTGLPNRASFMKHLEWALQQTREKQDFAFAVLFLDLDNFKQVNDRLGHLAGDQLLITIAHRLNASLRPNDVVARLGGDEFTVLLVNIRYSEDAAHIAQRLQNELAQPINLEGQEFSVSASIGIALSTSGYERAEDILHEADLIMYGAKRQGGGSYALSHLTTSVSANTPNLPVVELQRAIECQEFQLFYQPVVALATGKITGAEAVLRWWHPQRGLIMPEAFIPLAEETGLIIPLSEWVLRTACKQTQNWRAAGYPHLRMAVNISIRQFQPDNQHALPELIKTILKETGLPSQNLELEITETTPLTHQAEFNRAILNQFKTMGLSIALDDFKADSSVGLLRQFPFSTLKIDRSFISGVMHTPDNYIMTRAVINLAHELGLRVVVEGVETEAQLAWLGSQPCDELQGYLFSPPMPADRFTSILNQGDYSHLIASSVKKPFYEQTKANQSPITG